MFTLEDVFKQAFPMMQGINIDVFTIISALVLLSFIIMGFDYLKDLLSGHLASSRSNSLAHHYYGQAKQARNMMNSLNPDSMDYEEAQMLYKANLRRSVEHRLEGNSPIGSYGSSSLEKGSGIFDDDDDDKKRIDNSIKL